MQIKEVFEFVDGELWRKAYVRSNGRKYRRKLVKNIANANGYCDVSFKGRNVRYHRIIWVLLNGDIPAGMEIDHIDGNRVNNSITNLRLVSQRENTQNRIEHRNGRLVGCYYDKQRRKWRAQIQVNDKSKSLGRFHTEQEAHEAYKRYVQFELNQEVVQNA